MNFTKIAALLVVASTSVFGALSPRTVSEVCPAIQFTHAAENGSVYFIPEQDEPFKFVDLHIHLDYGDHAGPVVNYKMKKSQWKGKKVYKIDVQDGDIRHNLINGGNIQVKYAFTYCVLRNGKQVDCDTDSFLGESYDWHAGNFPSCPKACGLAPSEVYRKVECAVIGSGAKRSDDRCNPATKPPVKKSCPATQECEAFEWRAGQVECPTECGFPASTIPVPADCVGTFGNEGSAEQCGPAPRPVRCPATKPCVSYDLQPVAVACPTKCGLSPSLVQPKLNCIGSDGINYPLSNCMNSVQPGKQRCPATAPCVTFRRKALPVQCPSECGMPPGFILPDAQCYGSDGMLYPDVHCASLPRPSKIACPATAPCVTYMYQFDTQCPDECGLPPSIINPPLTCVGDDGSIAPMSECSDLTKPILQCPATQACAKPLPYCPSITFRQLAIKKQGRIEIYFVPTNPGAKRMRFDFVDVHYQTEGTPLLNHRMNVNKQNPIIGRKEGIEFMFTVDEPEVYDAIQDGAELAYSFTYCVEKTDCDTQTFYI